MDLPPAPEPQTRDRHWLQPINHCQSGSLPMMRNYPWFWPFPGHEFGPLNGYFAFSGPPGHFD